MAVIDYLDALSSHHQPEELKKFHVLSNITYLKLETFVKYYSSIFNNGLSVEFENFDVVENRLNKETGDNFIISLCFDDLNPSALDPFVTRMRSILGQVKKGSVDCVFTVPLLPYFRSETKSAISNLNDDIADYCSENNIICLDINELSMETSASSAYSFRHFFSKKIIFSEAAESAIAKAFVGHVMQDLNITKKCLILDCDNTLWGGVVGEDGVPGLLINKYDDRAKIYYDLQRRLKALKDLGIILCLATKNNLDDVKQAFTEVEMPLIWEDFAYHGASWDLKTLTISKIAQYLNLGLESCVFLDDSPYEIGLVKNSLPSVTCVTMPAKPHKIPLEIFPILQYYFHKSAVSSFDRTEAYKIRESAMDTKKQYADHKSFLKSLSININILVNDVEFIARYSEMTGRTNQFNSNKVPYTQAAMNEIIVSDKSYLFALEVTDVFGSHGITNLCYCRERADEAIVVETFLMSCRVVERMVEYAFLQLLVQKMGWKGRRIYFRFTKSEKNILAYNFLKSISGLQKDKHFELSHDKLESVDTSFITGDLIG